MAQVKVTRKFAATEILEYAKAHGYDNVEGIETMEKIIASFSRKSTKPTKSKARRYNELHCEKLHEMTKGLESFTGKWVLENFKDADVRTAQKVTAIMRLGVEIGLFEKIKEGKQVKYRAL